MGSFFRSSKSESASVPTYLDAPTGLEEIRRLLGYERTAPASWIPYSSHGETRYLPVAAKYKRSAGAAPLDEMFQPSIQGQESLLDMAGKLMRGESFGRDAGYEAEMGKLAAMGLATSAPGIIETGNNIYGRRMQGAQLMQEATQGLAALQALPIELRTKLLQMLLAPATAAQGSSVGGGGLTIQGNTGSSSK